MERNENPESIDLLFLCITFCSTLSLFPCIFSAFIFPHSQRILSSPSYPSQGNGFSFSFILRNGIKFISDLIVVIVVQFPPLNSKLDLPVTWLLLWGMRENETRGKWVKKEREREKKQKERREKRKSKRMFLFAHSSSFQPSMSFPHFPLMSDHLSIFHFLPPFINPSFRYPLITFVGETFLNLYFLSSPLF